MAEKIPRWDELDLETQKQEYENQRLAWKVRTLKKRWAENYVRLARALADEFGEEEVLDILEKVWFDLEYEGGKTWRKISEEDPVAALEFQYQVQHEGHQSLTTGPQDACFEDGCYKLIHYFCYLKEVFMNLDERKIGLSWCLGDFAAVRGFHPRAMLDFRNSQVRGEHFCYHVRSIEDTPDPKWDSWSKELSEKIGWRSIQKLEEEQS